MYDSNHYVTDIAQPALNYNENINSSDIIPIMKFPVTREQLQSYTLEAHQKEQAEEEIQKKLNDYIRGLCSEFSRNMERNLKLKEYAWIGLHLIPVTPDEKYLRQFIEKIRTLFLDCDISTDITRRYVLIKWS